MRLVLLSIISFFAGVSLAYLLICRQDSQDTSAATPSSTDSSSHDQHDDVTLQIRTPSCAGSTVNLFILIFSHPHSFKQRQVIRKTWLSHLQPLSNTAYVFVLSIANSQNHKLSLLLESKRYNDILFIHQDDTQSYSSKMLLSAFSWSTTHINFQHLLKCNDQSYISVTKLILELKHVPKNNLVWGYFIGNQNVTRSGYKAEHKWNLCVSYLPYAEGGGYVLSKDLVAYIVRMSPYLEHTDHEDIGVGVWISPIKNIRRHHDIRFNTGPMSRGCMNEYLITHPETPDSMTNKHYLLKTNGYLCQNEIEMIKSYHYNWTTPVMSCCK